MESHSLMEQSKELSSSSPIRVLIFDSTKMGCQLLAHMLDGSTYNVKVVGSVTEPTLEGADSLPEADIALISVNASDGPGSRFKLLREVRQSRLRCGASCCWIAVTANRSWNLSAPE